VARRGETGAHRRRTIALQRGARVVALALVVPAFAVGLSTAPAAAAPEDQLILASAQAAQLNAQIQANVARADVLDERYLQARRAVTVARRQVAATEKQIAQTEAAVEKLRSRAAGRAARLYMRAGNTDPIGFDVTNVQDLGSREQYGNAAAESDLRVIDELKTTESHLADQRDQLRGRLAGAQKKERTAQKAREEVESANKKLQKLLDSSDAQVKLLAASIEQQQMIDVAAAERAWLQRQAERQAARDKPGAVVPPDIGTPGYAPPGSAPSPGAWKAVAYARAQLGKPYVYAGAGPDVFDCSGLTMMAWAQAGVAMEHGSQSQYKSFPKVPIDQLQPGDLVFFGDTGPTNHHVGIVVGRGLMIDAPHTGAYVELVSYFRKDLVPLGSRPGA
jgi:cell wall-associated NlpC family hydrolase